MSPAVLLVCPHEEHRRTLERAFQGQHATIVHEFREYPTNGQRRTLLDLECDAVIVDIDTNRELALDLIENLCSENRAATVMAYSGAQDAQTLVDCMRAGAREFLAGTLAPNSLTEALVRASARRAEVGRQRVALGNLYIFLGAKGGVGATTLASNFAIALRNESAQKVALLDLNPCLGEVAIHLGIEKAEFTVADAIANEDRIDDEFVSTLLIEHSSGISVLAARDTYRASTCLAAQKAVSTVVNLLRNQFRYVVADAGRGLDPGIEALFPSADTIYVVAQLDVPSLRNAQRFVSYCQAAGYANLELVLNRFNTPKSEFDEARLTKTLGLSPRWKIPNEYATVRNCLNRGAPLIGEKNGIARSLEQMARRVCGKPEPQKKRGFRLFG